MEGSCTLYCECCMCECLFVENDQLSLVCTGCGTYNSRDVGYSFRPNFDKPVHTFHSAGYVPVTYNPRKEYCGGRYKAKFHWNERISQWLCRDPKIPADNWDRIRKEAETGGYGPKEDFSRSTVIRITRALGLQKYRERWKRILVKLNPDSPCNWVAGLRELPDWDSQKDGAISESNDRSPWMAATAVAFIEDFGCKAFESIVQKFTESRLLMPASVFRRNDGTLTKKQRHNLISYNYIIRKLLEAYGVWHFHREFPVPRHHGKLHALDDVTGPMFQELGYEFQRSTVIKRPKIKKG